jgi:hypothetical protein
MANFTAKIRRSYQDIDGLVLDCRPSGLALDGSLWTNAAPPARTPITGSHTGSNNASTLTDTSAYWQTNHLVGAVLYNVTDGSAGRIVANTQNTVTATLSGGTDDDWDTGDNYKITTPRFGNPYQNVATHRPTIATVSGVRQATFAKASSQFFKVPLDDSFIADFWTVAFEFEKGLSTSNDQTVVGFPNLEIYRRNSGGVYGYRYNSSSQNGGTDMPDAAWLLAFVPYLSGGTWSDKPVLYEDGSPVMSDWPTTTPVNILAGDPAGWIGSSDGSSDFADMVLKNIQIWDRHVSTLEIDFAFQTLHSVYNYAQQDRATMTLETWTDTTSPSQYNRIGTSYDVPQKFVQALLPVNALRRIQIAAAVDNQVLHDDDLGGKLFDIYAIEYPIGEPTVTTQTGWSSVFDITLRDPGHYTWSVTREDGGEFIVHLDVESWAP